MAFNFSGNENGLVPLIPNLDAQPDIFSTVKPFVLRRDPN